MKPMDFFRTSLWSSWRATQIKPIAIPPNRTELERRIRTDPFDGGRTYAWMSALTHPTVYGLQDQHTSHRIHCVSDRPLAALLPDLRLGLRLMAWMSHTPMTWYWWDHPWKRLLPADVDPGRDHVNGGFAIPGVPEVHVYRREEAHKVLLHEMCHARRLDVSVDKAGQIRQLFERSLGRSLWPHFGEAYTELLAEWLWAIASATSLRAAKQNWIAQRRCATEQAAQVWARIWDSRESETTNVFAYYIQKWVLMQHEEIVFFGSDHSVTHWFVWWLEARPTLDAMAQSHAASVQRNLPMGMTCKRD